MRAGALAVPAAFCPVASCARRGHCPTADLASGVALLEVEVSSIRAERERDVRDLWAALLPVYREFGVRLPDREPKTLVEAMRPLLMLTETLPTDESPDPIASEQ